MSIHMTNVSVLEDIDLACKVIDGVLVPPKESYNSYSMIYRTTNENISHKPYVAALQGRQDVLAITGSGDQILNSIFFGGKNITSIDISRFSKYYLCLKLAAIKTLSEEDYLMFINADYNTLPLSIKYYEIVRKELDQTSCLFWDSIYHRYNDRELYQSDLFGTFRVSECRAVVSNPFLQECSYTEYRNNLEIASNPFLQKTNYDELKAKINDVNIKLYDGDIFLVDQMQLSKCDLALLSNMFNYVNPINATIEEKAALYKRFLDRLPLKDDGIALTYNFTFDGFMGEFFKGKKYEVYKVNEQLRDIDINNEILIYKKKKSKYNINGKKQ